MYHVAAGGVQKGQIEKAELLQRIAEGEFAPTNLCWREGWPAWKALGVEFPKAAWPLRPQPWWWAWAVASLGCGAAAMVVNPSSAIFAWLPALGCGHLARAQIKRAKGGVLAGGVALVGLTLGYVAVTRTAYSVVLPTMSSYDVEAETLKLTMCSDARVIAQAAGQHFLEAEDNWVPFSYDRATGTVGGPLAASVSRIKSGYTLVPKQLTRGGTFQLQHPRVGAPLTFASSGQLVE